MGDHVITISNLEINSIPAGSITLEVATIPAPASLGLLALVGGLMGARRRR